jgi:hypothetical protein
MSPNSHNFFTDIKLSTCSGFLFWKICHHKHMIHEQCQLKNATEIFVKDSKYKISLKWGYRPLDG